METEAVVVVAVDRFNSENLAAITDLRFFTPYSTSKTNINKKNVLLFVFWNFDK